MLVSAIMESRLVAILAHPHASHPGTSAALCGNLCVTMIIHYQRLTVSCVSYKLMS